MKIGKECKTCGQPTQYAYEHYGKPWYVCTSCGGGGYLELDAGEIAKSTARVPGYELVRNCGSCKWYKKSYCERFDIRTNMKHICNDHRRD